MSVGDGRSRATVVVPTYTRPDRPGATEVERALARYGEL